MTLYRILFATAFILVVVQIGAKLRPDRHVTRTTAPTGQWLKGDMHVHNDHSSDGSGTRQGTGQRGPGNVSVADQIGMGVIDGLNWMPLTDHRTYDQHYDPLWESSDLLLVPGEEANGSPHAVVLGAVDMIVQGGDTPGRPGFARLQTSIWDTHSQGAILSHAHPDDGHLNADDTPNERANAVGADAMEVWNKASGIARELKYAENRWNLGYRFGVVGASDNHFRELWGIAGPGNPVTHVFALDASERAILQGLQNGHALINARSTGTPLTTLEADMDGDGIYEAIAGDEIVAAPQTPGTLRIHVQLGAGTTVSLYKSPGKSAGALQTFMPALPDETFTVNITAEQGPTWCYVETRGFGEVDSIDINNPTQPPAPDQRRAITSPIFIGPNLAVPQPAVPTPPDAGVEDGAQLVLGNAGAFSGFPDVAVDGAVTHIVAEQHSPGRTAVWYRRLSATEGFSAAVDLAPASATARFPKIAARGSDVWVAWQDERAGQVPRRPAIYLRHSTDGGTTWQPETLIRQITGRAEKPDLALTSDGKPVVAWQEISAGNPFDVMAQIVGSDASPLNLSRAGKTVQAANVADTRSARYPASVWPVVTVRDDDLIAVGFQDNRTDPDPLWTGAIFTGEDNATEVDNWQILVCTRAGNGGTWSAPSSIGNDERADRHPAVAFTPDGALVAAWDSKTLNASGTNLSVRYSVSTDDGATWSDASNPPALAENPGVMSQYPKLGRDADARVRAVWYDTRSVDWRWRVMTAILDSGTWQSRLLMGRGINTWPAVDRGKIVFASTRNATRSQRDPTHQIFVVDGIGIEPLGVVSRKTHGTSGTFDVNLPLVGNPGIECRSGGTNNEHTLVFTFPDTLTSVSNVSLNGTGNASGAIGADPHQYIVNLDGVANAQTITVTLSGVSNAGDVSVLMGVLLGDVNSSRVVTGSDVNLAKAQQSKPLTADPNGNFRSDVNASGVITGSDVNLIKGKQSTNL